MKLKIDLITLIFFAIPIIAGLTLVFGILDINGEQQIFKKIPFEQFKKWDCDTQLRYLASTIPPETHRQYYIEHCMNIKNP